MFLFYSSGAFVHFLGYGTPAQEIAGDIAEQINADA